MTIPMEFGAVRQIWLRQVGDVASAKPFLMRDDTFSKGAAQFGRSIRLGDPIDLGPNSNWLQTSWKGGRRQDIWNDKEMYKEGFVCPTEDKKLSLWPGWKQITGSTNRTVTGHTFCTSLAVNPWNLDISLIIGERSVVDRGMPSGGFRVSQWSPTTGNVTDYKTDFAGSINSIAPLSDIGNPDKYVAIGAGHEFWRWDVTAGAGGFTKEYDAAYEIAMDSIVPFGEATYYVAGQNLYKRTFDTGTLAVTHAVLKRIPTALMCRGLVAWNSKLWFVAVKANGETSLYVSDGATVTHVLDFEDNFEVKSAIVHYGNLYFAGQRSTAKWGTGTVGEVWKYTGSALTKLFETTDRVYAAENQFLWDMCSWGKFLVWGRAGYASTGRLPGVMFYDAESDAIIDGPTFDMDPNSPEVQVTSLANYDGTIVASFWDNHNYSDALNNGPTATAILRNDQGVRNIFTGIYGSKSFNTQPNTLARTLTSSSFDGEVPGEDKTWLSLRVTYELEANTEIKLSVLLDDSTSPAITPTTLTYTGAGKKVVVIPLKDSGGYLKSKTIQYKVELHNTDYSFANSTTNPKVESVEVAYMVAPKKRRQWQVRVLASNAQNKLNGSPNPITTAASMLDTLEALATDGKPVEFYEPAADPAGVPGTPIECWVQSWSRSDYAIDSKSGEIAGEFAMTLVEVVQT